MSWEDENGVTVVESVETMSSYDSQTFDTYTGIDMFTFTSCEYCGYIYDFEMYPNGCPITHIH